MITSTKALAMVEEVTEGDMKVSECLICGKLFPRGPMDLARHGAAVTLKHFISDKKTTSFPFGCKKCIVYFASKEHLDMHYLKSRCNPLVVAERIEEAIRLESGTGTETESKNDQSTEHDENISEESMLVDDSEYVEIEETLTESLEPIITMTVQKKELRVTKEITSTSVANLKPAKQLIQNSAILLCTNIEKIGDKLIGKNKDKNSDKNSEKNKNEILSKEQSLPLKELFKESSSIRHKARNIPPPVVIGLLGKILHLCFLYYFYVLCSFFFIA